MVNKVFLCGRLGKDPVLNTKTQQPVCRFSLATTEKRAARDGQPASEHTEWHNITVWAKQAESCAKYLTKGRKVIVEGRISTNEWQKDDGTKMRSTEIVASAVHFLDSPNQAQSAQGLQPQRAERREAKNYAATDEIPF